MATGVRGTSEQAAPAVRRAAGARVPYAVPVLEVLGTFQALTQTKTCAKGYNDGTGSGCSMSFKKS